MKKKLYKGTDELMGKGHHRLIHYMSRTIEAIKEIDFRLIMDMEDEWNEETG